MSLKMQSDTAQSSSSAPLHPPQPQRHGAHDSFQALQLGSSASTSDDQEQSEKPRSRAQSFSTSPGEVSDQTQYSCRLLQLPRELRDLIYSFVYPGETITVRRPKWESFDAKRIEGIRSLEHSQYRTGLLSTCKQIRSETLSFFFGRNVFRGFMWNYWCCILSPEAMDALTEIRDGSDFELDFRSRPRHDVARFEKLESKVKFTSLSIHGHKGIRNGVAKMRLSEDGKGLRWAKGPNGEEVWSAAIPSS